MNIFPSQKKKKTGQPGCIVFLDFSKAYDRLSRSWVQNCMSSMGFGQNACQWVSIMLHNTSATATFNGWRSASFPERSGVQQGSPLSPLLYVIAAQPLASHLRRQSQLGIIRPIFFFFFFFFFLGGKDIHYTSAMIATSRVCDVHHKPKRPKLTTHLEWFRHKS